MAVEAFRRHQCGVEHRRGIAVADHCQQVLHRALSALAGADRNRSFVNNTRSRYSLRGRPGDGRYALSRLCAFGTTGRRLKMQVLMRTLLGVVAGLALARGAAAMEAIS